MKIQLHGENRFSQFRCAAGEKLTMSFLLLKIFTWNYFLILGKVKMPDVLLAAAYFCFLYHLATHSDYFMFKIFDLLVNKINKDANQNF